MDQEFELVKAVLGRIPKKDLARLILNQIEEQIPITIFTTKLSPLESITRYLKEQNKGTNEIASILNKPPSSISQAYKTAKTKPFKITESKISIPLTQFQNKKLSILEIVIFYLKNQDLKLVKIAALLKRNPKTIWTVYNRAKNKLK